MKRWFIAFFSFTHKARKTDDCYFVVAKTFTHRNEAAAASLKSTTKEKHHN